MQQLVVIDHPRLAQAFVDYMATLSIECRLAPASPGVAIYLVDDNQIEPARRELEAFLKNPLDPKYQAASWQVGDAQHSPLQYHSSTSLIRSRLLQHAGPVTLGMMIVAVLVYVLLHFINPEGTFYTLRFAESWQGILSQPWRLVTPILLHFSIFHILFNLLWWWELGGMIEKRLGSGKLIVISLVAAIIPNMAQFWFSGPNFGGLSAVVYAQLGYLWWTQWLRPHLQLPLNRGLVIFMIGWLIFGFFNTFGPATANMAHLFGLIVGCLQALFDKATDKGTS